MDTIGQRNLFIVRTNNDATVRFAVAMQADEILPIICQDRPTDGSRKGENMGITASLLSCFPHGEDIVPQQPKLLNDGISEILVCAKVGHGGSGIVVFLNVFFNLLDIVMKISQSGFNVSRRQRSYEII
jgi:hypothetical protein